MEEDGPLQLITICEIIGLNMWASVNWDPVQFVRQLPWLKLEPPPPAMGLCITCPLDQGGRWRGPLGHAEASPSMH